MNDGADHLTVSMSEDLVRHYKRENVKFRPPKPPKTRHHFIIPKSKVKTKK